MKIFMKVDVAKKVVLCSLLIQENSCSRRTRFQIYKRFAQIAALNVPIDMLDLDYKNISSNDMLCQ